MVAPSEWYHNEAAKEIRIILLSETATGKGMESKHHGVSRREVMSATSDMRMGRGAIEILSGTPRVIVKLRMISKPTLCLFLLYGLYGIDIA